MIDPLLNHTVRHQVDMAGYGNFVLAKMIRILNLTDSDLIGQLNEALIDVDATEFKVQRLDSLLKSAREVNSQAYAALYEGMTEQLEAYVEYEGQFQYDLYKSIVPVDFSIAAIVPSQVYAAAVAQPMQGRLLKEWAAGLGQNRLQRIKDTIAVGYTQGKTTSDIVKEIRGTKALNYADGLLDTSRREVEAVVRTALSHTAQITRNEFYRENDDILGDEMWISTLDGKTSHQCRARDHLKYTKVDHKPVGHSVPYLAGPGRLHWRCRSTSLAMLKGQTMLYGERSAAGGPINANLSYNDWLKAQSAEAQDEILGKAKGRAYRAGGYRAEAFQNDRGRLLTLKEMAARDAKAFKQPQGLFTIYDPGVTRTLPDTSTPARAAAVALEEKIRRDTFETGAVFDADGRLLVKRVGAADSVEFSPADFRTMRGQTFTHNHPLDGTFSPQDVRLASQYGIGELRAVGPTTRHIMSAPDGWPTRRQLAAAIVDLGPVVQREIDAMIQAGDLTRPYAQREIDHRFWEKVAAKFNLKYTREAS